MAFIFGERDFRRATLDRLLSTLDEETEANEDSLSAQVKGFLSRTPGAAIVDMLVNDEAICSQYTQFYCKLSTQKNIISHKSTKPMN